MKRIKISTRSKQAALVSMDALRKDKLFVGRLPHLVFETQPLVLKDNLVIVMNRDPCVHGPDFVHTLSPLEITTHPCKTVPTLHSVLITRSANEIRQDLQQAMERYEDIIAQKQLPSPKGLEVHLHQDSAGHAWGRLDCLGKKGLHSREIILDAYGDHVKIYSSFMRNKKISLLEKADIIFASLGISLPLQHASYPYPDTLYYINQSVNNQLLIEAIRKRFEILKSLYGEYLMPHKK